MMKCIKLLLKLTRIEYFIQGIFKTRNIECPHCRSKRVHKNYQKYYVFDILECKDCLISFMNPIYKSFFSSNVYDKIYQAEGSIANLPSKHYLEKLKGENFSNSDKNFSTAIGFIRELIHKEDINLLELGSSWGYFLFQANSANINSTGIEISNSRREYGNKNLKTNIEANIKDVKGKKYDVIFSNHVLEYFTDLSEIFQDLSSLLVDDGLIIIAVPNYNYYEK